jgi:hypothetical protein
MTVGFKKLQPDGTSVFIASKECNLATSRSSQPTVEKDERWERSKQTNDDFVGQYWKMQKHFVEAADSLRTTFSVIEWEKDFGVDTVEGVLRADWNKPLRASGAQTLIYSEAPCCRKFAKQRISSENCAKNNNAGSVKSRVLDRIKLYIVDLTMKTSCTSH